MFDSFLDQDQSRLYRTEGGTETEIMCKHGFEFPHFAVFELFDKRHPHIDMWGGCCGTWDRHLGEIARTVSAARRQ